MSPPLPVPGPFYTSWASSGETGDAAGSLKTMRGHVGNGMGQEGAGAEFCFKSEGNLILALLVLIKEPCLYRMCQKSSCFLISSSSEGTQLPPYLSFTGEGDHVIRRTEMPTHNLQRAKALFNCICKLVGNTLRISNLPRNICA